ncbi:MAG: hypothetical protein HC896_08195, partial [Bacteroidales bacterium]|nr:hypothetical protein [Bacteroidales bacterium]
MNGSVPVDVTYELSTEDAAYLLNAGVASEVVAKLNDIIENVYTSYDDFQDDLIAAIDTPLTQSLMPIIIPIARIVEYQPGTVLEGISGSISHNASNLTIGENFTGNIDEIRIWSKARDEETVKYDYKRLVGNDADGIAGYWRCDENFGNYIYDASKSNGEFHKNNGAFNGNTWSTTIPNKNLLGWMGKADANGFYTIPYIPYFGTGENFTLTPRYEQHEFEPGSKTVFLGEGAAILDEQNFTDISSFKLTGTVFYENTYCGVEGAIIGIDGSPV